MDSLSWFLLGYLVGSDDDEEEENEDDYLGGYTEKDFKRIKRLIIGGIIAFLIFIIVLICVCCLVRV